MALPDSPQSEASFTTPQGCLDNHFASLILGQIEKIETGTAWASGVNREPVPFGKEEGIGRDVDMLYAEGTPYLTIAALHAERYGVNIAGALRVLDTEKPDRAPCILVVKTPFLMGENPTPITQNNTTVIAALEKQKRYQLAA